MHFLFIIYRLQFANWQVDRSGRCKRRRSRNSAQIIAAKNRL